MEADLALRDSLETSEGQNHQSIHELKTLGIKYIREKWIVNPIHRLGVFLHPQVKCQFFSPEEKEETIGLIREQIHALNGEQSILGKQNKGEVRGPPSKKKKQSIISLLIDQEDENIDEVLRYLEKVIFVRQEEELDVCSWWKEHKEKYPGLYALFQKYACVPVTSACAESKFSQAGFVINCKRTSLSPSSVNDILFLKSYFDEK